MRLLWVRGGKHKMSSDCDRVKEGVKKVKD